MHDLVETSAPVQAETAPFTVGVSLYRFCRGALVSVCAALQFLTIVPALVRRPFTAAELGRAVGFFPLIGAALGGALIGIDWLALLVWPAGLATALVLTSWVLLTGGLHLDGLLDSCDGILGGRTPADRLRILRDERVGAYAVIAGILLILVKFQALLAAPDRALALLLAPTLGRGAMAWAIVLTPYARFEGLGRAMKDGAGWRQAALAGATVALVLCLCGSGLGFVALGLAALVSLLVCRFVLARLPGLTGDVYGALCELVEVATLLVLATGGRA
jgi:adenosylcobinamide-GDP ribazoletransferase